VSANQNGWALLYLRGGPKAVTKEEGVEGREAGGADLRPWVPPSLPFFQYYKVKWAGWKQPNNTSVWAPFAPRSFSSSLFLAPDLRLSIQQLRTRGLLHRNGGYVSIRWFPLFDRLPADSDILSGRGSSGRRWASSTSLRGQVLTILWAASKLLAIF